MKTRLFIKPYCGWCHKAMRWLDDHDIAYEKLDVIADDAAFAEMIRLSGGTRAGAGRGWENSGGFRPGRIAKILGNR